MAEFKNINEYEQEVKTLEIIIKAKQKELKEKIKKQDELNSKKNKKSVDVNKK